MESMQFNPSRILIETIVSAEFQTVISNFNQSLFDALKPPLMPLKLIRYDGEKTGDEVHLELGFSQNWISLITDHGFTEDEWFFIDEGKVLPWPMRYWKHVHKVIRVNNAETSIVDDISFSTGSVVLNVLIYPFLYLQICYRKPAYKKYFRNIQVNN